MSKATIVRIWPGEKTECDIDLRNAFGFGPSVWGNVCQKYLGDGNWMMQEKKLWPLWRDERLPLHQRAVLGMTYDRVYILKEDYARAAEDIRKYLADFPVDDRKINHWPAIAEYLESNPDCPAVGFWGTSVCENPWQGEYDEELDDYGSVDWSDKWSLYEHLEVSDEEESQV